MEAKDFRAFVEQLGDLSGVQRSALTAALAGQGSANEAIALIEMRFAAAPACGHCQSAHQAAPLAVGSCQRSAALQVQGLRSHL